MVTRELIYERPTKRYQRFVDPDRGTVQYIANEDFDALGRPERIVMAFEAAAAPALRQAA